METGSQKAQALLQDKVVGDIRGTFIVPSYQRGYRWDPDDVLRLLDDIWKTEGKPYSLQPVVIKRLNESDTDQGQKWELVDGQQRLTTLYLILLYMKKQGWQRLGASYSIEYATRPDSQAYLETLDAAMHEGNIDFFHLYKAYECIGRWFEKDRDLHAQQYFVSTFYRFLCESVRVIWYEAPENLDDNKKDSTELFTRLNVGRIPLTAAELVKALLLSSVQKIHLERAPELAAQWDGIERDLRDPDIWAFVAGAEANRDADKYPTRISLLLDTLADATGNLKEGDKRPRYYTFDMLSKQLEADASKFEFWNKVVELHALILGWFGTPALYNKIGFLVSTGTPFGRLVKLAEGKRKSDFENSLFTLIRDDIGIQQSELMELSYVEKKRDYPLLMRLLLLMNVEATSRMGQRFPFRRHVGKTWSLEHIHAQNAENLTDKKQWKSWLEEHKKALSALPDHHDLLLKKIENSLAVIDSANNFGDTFRNLASQIIKVFEGTAIAVSATDTGLHSITNLALLSSGDNSALSNSVFEVKRQIVLAIDRNIDGKGDAYIPICTRNVFLKYFTDADSQQIHFWSPQDKDSYFKAIVATLKEYLTPEITDRKASQ